MRMHLKPIQEQVIVITGASSGIGLVTARMAAEQGAKVVLVARDRDALGHICEEIRQHGGTAVHTVADVADEAAMQKVADFAVQSFGGIDTWVNNAGVSIYGRIEEVTMEDHRRLFETNYWGVVIGSRIAARHLRQRGGALINLGSVLSERAIPLQGQYSATKHAVKAFTDALRMELEADGAPISVTLIKPASIDTGYEEHARNYMDQEPTVPQPVYAPELVAQAILHAAQHPVRDLFVGGGGKAFQWGERYAPRMTDYLMERMLFRAQKGGPRLRERDSLHEPWNDGHARSGRHGFVRHTSLYTSAEMHPWTTVALFAGLGALAMAAYSGRLPGLGGNGRSRNRRMLDARRRQHAAGMATADTEGMELGHNAKPAGEAAHESYVTFPR